MSNQIERLRAYVISSPNVEVGTAHVVTQLLNIAEAQEAAITQLADELRTQLQRCEDRESGLQRQIDKLKGTHGA